MAQDSSRLPHASQVNHSTSAGQRSDPSAARRSERPPLLLPAFQPAIGPLPLSARLRLDASPCRVPAS
jgi:hypothetical protein